MNLRKNFGATIEQCPRHEKPPSVDCIILIDYFMSYSRDLTLIDFVIKYSYLMKFIWTLYSFDQSCNIL